MNDNRNSGNRPRDSRGNRIADDFELNISDEMFNTTPDIPLAGIDATQSFSTSRKTMEGSSTNAYYADNEQKKNKKEHKKRDKIKGIKNRRVFRVVWWAMVILVSLTFASYLITGSNDFLAVGHQEGVAQITIPKDVTVDQLTDILSKGGVIKSPEFFKIYCSVTTKMSFFDPGSFEVATNLDYEAIINTLQAGKPLGEEVKITFPEGVNIQQIAALLEENGVCTAQEALDAAKTVNFDEYDMIGAVKNGDKKYYKLEGYLFPDTYTFNKGEELKSVLGKFLNDFQIRITSDVMDQITSSQMSMDQIITLASIIQAEAADTGDMYKVSAVLHNRLDRGGEAGTPRLQCDSTIYYPYKNKEDAPAGYESSYNTYEIQGLPEGAICNPGIDAIKAALNPDPENADSFYFCHSADGTAYYASTAEGHQENLQAAGLND